MTERALQRHWNPGLWLGVCALLAYANSFQAALTLDNKLILLNDPGLAQRTWQSFATIFTKDYWWPNFPSDLYRPLTTLSYFVNYSLLGEGARPAGYHCGNFLLHW